MGVREGKRLQKEKERKHAIDVLPDLVVNLGVTIDHLQEQTKKAGIKIHAETWKALHRHQQNIGASVAGVMLAESEKEVA